MEMLMRLLETMANNHPNVRLEISTLMDPIHRVIIAFHWTKENEHGVVYTDPRDPLCDTEKDVIRLILQIEAACEAK